MNIEHRLPNENEYIITHYGCSNFQTETNTIFWIGAIYFENYTKKYFFENGNEIDIIKKYYLFLKQNKDKTIIHWSMNSPKFGFLPIQKRINELGDNSSLDINEFQCIDLSEYLKTKYGENYVSRKNGRLNNLAVLNNFSGFKDNVEVKTLNDANNRLELFYSIVCCDKQGVLKIEVESMDLPFISKSEEKIIIFKEPSGEMFSNNGFELFEHILNEYVKPKNIRGRYEDLSYYYRCLNEDKYIHQKPEPFRLWFINKYEDEFTKIKTKVQTASQQRKKDYSSALDWFNSQNK